MEANEFEKRIIEDSKKIGVMLNEQQGKDIRTFTELMKEWNEKINLTKIVEDEEIIPKHIIDSLTLFNTGKLEGEKTLIDVGTGAGFPSIPVKIANPLLKVTLLDSLNKRLKYLDEVIHVLGLENIETLHVRAEDGGRDKIYRDTFDIATARAVANLASLAELCLPFVKIGGFFLCMKGPAYIEELKTGEKAIELLGGKVIETIQCEIPGTDLTHNIIVIEKVKRSPKGYPRKAGMPNSNPIG